MLALIPLLLLGGVVAFGWAGPSTPPPAAMQAGVGLGGYLQGVVGTLAGDPSTARQGLMSALVDDPDNLGLRQRAMEAALTDGDTTEALRLAQSLPTEARPPLAVLLSLTEALAKADTPSARSLLAGMRAQKIQLPLGIIWQAYLDAARGLKTGPLAAHLQVSLPGWSGRWHAARLWRSAGDDAKALALLHGVVTEYPSALLPLLDYLPLVPAAEQTRAVAAFASENPTLSPLVTFQGSPHAPLPGFKAGGLGNHATAALLEFSLQAWAEDVPLLAKQLLNLVSLLPADDPWLLALRTYYLAAVTDTLEQSTEASALYQPLAKRPDGLGFMAQLRLNELQAQQATNAGVRRQALQAGQALAARYPQEPLGWQSLLALAMANRSYTTAAQAATRLLELLPATPSSTLPERQADLYFARGAAWAMAKRSKPAEADLQQAIALNPGHAEALNYLGYLWVDEGRNLTEAYRLLKQAHLLAPNNGAITDSIGWAYYRKGDYETAQHYLEMAAQQEPGMPEILSHLADTYFKLGQQDEALKLWRRALDFAQQGADVPSKQFLRELERKVGRGTLE